MSIELSLSQARRIILNSQRLSSRRTFSKSVEGTLEAIEHLGYVQIDTLSVVERAHSHTLWNRVNGFKADHIDTLQKEKQIFEHWSHALSYLPMKHYRYSLPMMNRIAKGEVHWYQKDSKETKKVLKRIREEGPLSAKDFTDKKSSSAMWSRSPSKRALEQLFMEGVLMIPERKNFHKVYDLRERVLPEAIDTIVPSDKEFCKHLIFSYLNANGIGSLKEFYYLRKGLGSIIGDVVEQLIEEGSVVELAVNKSNDPVYYALSDNLEKLQSAKAPTSIRILSPFDNGVIQRKRLLNLFDYDYQIECYVPKAKRKFGYFCLPILQGDKFVARIDAKADRKSKVFSIMQLHIEKPIRSIENFYSRLEKELRAYSKFCGCEKINLEAVKGSKIRPRWL